MLTKAVGNMFLSRFFPRMSTNLGDLKVTSFIVLCLVVSNLGVAIPLLIHRHLMNISSLLQTHLIPSLLLVSQMHLCFVVEF